MHTNITPDNISSSILEYHDDLILVLDLDFKIININSAAKNILKLSSQEAVGQNLFSICNNKQIEISFTANELNNLKTSKYKSSTGYIIDIKKQKKSISWHQHFIKNSKKNGGHFLIFGKDLTLIEKYQKEASLSTIYLKNLLENLPEYIYWKDLDFVYRGCNKRVSDSLGLASPKDMIGKTDKDFGWSEERVKTLYKIDKTIIETGINNIVEDLIPQFDGSERTMLSSKAPMLDENNNIIGIVGISVDLTDYKKAERLILENELQRTKLDEQEKFKKIVDQVVHDIRSPLASLSMIVKSCASDLPEKIRISLREAAANINDIANNLLSKYKTEDSGIYTSTTDGQQHRIMVSLILLQVLSEKRHQYKEIPVRFTHTFDPDCNFVFIEAEPNNFKRMLSNLINNAVESLEEKKGTINLELKIKDQQAKIIIQDNGKGIPKDVINKIINKIPVTAGKKNGSGIGFTQINETLALNQGKLKIDSKMDKGTKITLTFPKVPAPEWLVKKISLNKGDTVVVLDDDSSIHNAWETQFKNHTNKVHLKHFTSGEETIKFINTFPEREKIFLLADFELLKQNLTGLDVIEKTDIKRSILVTSHYTNLTIRDLAIKNQTKILPKPLASEIEIEISNSPKTLKNKINLNKVDIVLIDDNKVFVDTLAMCIKHKGKTVDAYLNPDKFLKNISLYTKDTIIFMDNNFENNMNGLELAKQLHEKGYYKLYLITGTDFAKDELPNYLMSISKMDISKLLDTII